MSGSLHNSVSIDVASRALERLLLQFTSDEKGTSTALLNALLVETDAPPVRPWIVQAIRDALISSVSVDSAVRREVMHRVDVLISAASPLPSDEGPVKGCDAGRTVYYSLAGDAREMVAYLRFSLGLSVRFVHRHFRDRLGASIPSDALLGCIAKVTRPATARARRSRR